MRHIVLEELFQLGHAHQRQSACLGEYRPKALDFFILRVPRQRRPLHEAERHPESHRTAPTSYANPCRPASTSKRSECFFFYATAERWVRRTWASAPTTFPFGAFFGPRLVAFCVPLGFGENFPILVMGKQRTTGGAAKEDAGCVRNPPILICIQVLRRAGAIAKRRGALRCHTL